MSYDNPDGEGQAKQWGLLGPLDPPLVAPSIYLPASIILY